MNEIFAHFITRGDNTDAEKRLGYAVWFTHSFPESEFETDEFLFYNYLRFSSKLGAAIKYNYFQVWLDTELRQLLHKSNCKVVGCEGLRYEDPLSFETAVRTTTEVMQDNFKALEVVKSEVDDFPVLMTAFMQSRREERLTQALASAYEMLNSTDDSSATAEELYMTMAKIKSIYNIAKLDKLNQRGSGDIAFNDKLISKCGLPLIDNDCDGIFESQLFGVEAQPGTGKTRFVLGTFVYLALTSFKVSVIFYALEQRRSEVYAMLISKHIFEMFNVQLADKHIIHNDVPEEYKHYVEAARYDLFESGKYGKFECSDDDLFVEEFEETLSTDDKILGPFDLVVIDYMGMMKSKPTKYGRSLNTTEIIAEGYPKFKAYVRNRLKGGIAIGQFSREGVAAGEADKKITTEMAQGGMVVYRNTDYNIALSATDTMKAQQKRRLSQPKVRGSSGFPSFIMDTRLGILYFKQAVRKEA